MPASERHEAGTSFREEGKTNGSSMRGQKACQGGQGEPFQRASQQAMPTSGEEIVSFSPRPVLPRRTDPPMAAGVINCDATGSQCTPEHSSHRPILATAQLLNDLSALLFGLPHKGVWLAEKNPPNRSTTPTSPATGAGVETKPYA